MNNKENILILGGLGFIGKNLYRRLSEEHFKVTILADRITPEDEEFLIAGKGKNVIQGNVLDGSFMERTIAGYDVIFCLAGHSGASDSVKDPCQDLNANLNGHLNVLEACRKSNVGARLIFPSTRLVYGKPLKNPVNESHSLNPESIYAINKLTAEYYYRLYHRVYGIRSVIFRISNPFGPYQKFGSNHYGILNWFINKAVSGQPLEIYGDGSQQRDFLYVDDLVDVFRRSIESRAMDGKIYNIGYGIGISLREAAERVARNVPGTRITYKPWPEIDQKIETGDYISDIRLIQADTGWKPQTDFEEGVRKTIEYYGRR